MNLSNIGYILFSEIWKLFPATEFFNFIQFASMTQTHEGLYRANNTEL